MSGISDITYSFAIIAQFFFCCWLRRMKPRVANLQYRRVHVLSELSPLQDAGSIIDVSREKYRTFQCKRKTQALRALSDFSFFSVAPFYTPRSSSATSRSPFCRITIVNLFNQWDSAMSHVTTWYYDRANTMNVPALRIYSINDVKI